MVVATRRWLGMCVVMFTCAMLAAAVQAQDSSSPPADGDAPRASAPKADEPEADEPEADEPKAGASEAEQPAGKDHQPAGKDHPEGNEGGAGHTEGHENEGAGHDSAGGTHAAGHHDETDLSHGNATASLESPEEFKSDLAIYTLIVFLLLLAILWKFAWGPIVEGLDKREQSIAGAIADAEKNNAAAQQRLAEYEKRLAEANAETRELMAAAHRDGEATKERIVAEAQEVARREKDRAIAEINSAKNQALRDVAQKGTDIAVDLAGQIVGRELRDDDHAQLIRDTLDKFPSQN